MFDVIRARLLLSGLFAVLFVTGTGLTAAQDKPKPEAKPAPSSTKPVPREKNWLKRHEGFVAIAKRGGVDVLFVGDSITDAWGGEGHSAKASGAKVFEKE